MTKPVPGTGALAPEVAQGLRHRAARHPAHARRQRRAHGAGLAALRRQHLAEPAGRASGAPAPRRRTSTRCARVERAVRSEILRQADAARRRRADHAGDPALLRDDRRHPSGPQQGGSDRLPVLPRARPRADRAGPGVGRVAARRRCPNCRPRAGRACVDALGRQRRGHGADDQRRRRRPRRRDRRRRRAGRRGPQLVDGLPRAEGERARGRRRPNWRSTRRRSPG